ncbi:VOC family protein [Lactococcus insecticola]|uniref:Glyoxalase n=1 Tax=Pseudolactococcus insecticola TaxID=2709158 RepID=A0A6A0B6G7_9LACT|nr:VOC family protein [Lactococcus insecticola]GFH40325.1 glyoxalase [Lactococcus insecticola]
MQTHHVSLLTGDFKQNAHFYVDILGLRFIKNSINQANPHMRHVYYGDFVGTPGTVVTFFPDKKLDRDRLDGRMYFSGLHFGVPFGTIGYWQARFESFGLAVSVDARNILHTQDFDAIPIELKEVDKAAFDWHVNFLSDVPAENQVTGVIGTELHVPDVDATANFFADIFGKFGVTVKGNVINLDGPEAIYLYQTAPDAPESKFGRGSTDHFALGVTSSSELDYIWERAGEHGWTREVYVDRGYFNSVYLIEPGGNRVEIATTNPGFTLDESVENLGTTFAMPPRFDGNRDELQKWYAEQGIYFDDYKPYTGTGRPGNAAVKPIHDQKGNTRND